ncbi:enoyl-CoA delta isomerase 2, peroxisomal-like [Wolffia australiana]
MCSLEKRGGVFVLTLTGDGEHRLGPALIDELRAALAKVRAAARAAARAEPRAGLALVTIAEGKFFSNGFDLAWTQAADSPDGSHRRLSSLVAQLKLAIADLVSLPLPTVAAITGHAAAAGLILALAHDYAFMRKDRGVLYMSELDMGIPIPEYFISLINAKVSNLGARRDLVLKAAKMAAAEAAEKGVIDVAVEGSEGTALAAIGLGEKLAGRRWDGRVYASIRTGIFSELARELGLELEPPLQIMQKIMSKI